MMVVNVTPLRTFRQLTETPNRRSPGLRAIRSHVSAMCSRLIGVRGSPTAVQGSRHSTTLAPGHLGSQRSCFAVFISHLPLCQVESEEYRRLSGQPSKRIPGFARTIRQSPEAMEQASYVK